MLATPATVEPSLRMVEAKPELGPPEELLWPVWWSPRTWRPWWDWAQDRVKRSRVQASAARLEPGFRAGGGHWIARTDDF